MFVNGQQVEQSSKGEHIGHRVQGLTNITGVPGIPIESICKDTTKAYVEKKLQVINTGYEIHQLTHCVTTTLSQPSTAGILCLSMSMCFLSQYTTANKHNKQNKVNI